MIVYFPCMLNINSQFNCNFRWRCQAAYSIRDMRCIRGWWWWWWWWRIIRLNGLACSVVHRLHMTMCCAVRIAWTEHDKYAWIYALRHTHTQQLWCRPPHMYTLHRISLPTWFLPLSAAASGSFWVCFWCSNRTPLLFDTYSWESKCNIFCMFGF